MAGRRIRGTDPNHQDRINDLVEQVQCYRCVCEVMNGLVQRQLDWIEKH
jgi:hypothetical protein